MSLGSLSSRDDVHIKQVESPPNRTNAETASTGKLIL